MYKKVTELTGIKFVKDSVWTMFSHFFVGISGLLINTLVGNRYHAEGLGLLNQALSIYMLLTLVANFGIQTSVQKYASQYSGDSDKLINIFTSAVISTGGVSIAIGFISYCSFLLFPNWLSSKELTQIVLAFIIAAPLFSINKTINNFLVGIREFVIYANIRILRWIGVIASILYMYKASLPLDDVGFFFIAIESIILFYFIIIMRKYWGSVHKDWIKTHLGFGIKNIMVAFVVTFNTRAPILIIGYVLGNIASGYFSYVETFARSILMISSALQKNFNPVFTKLWYEGKVEDIKEKMNRVFKVSLYSLLPVIVGIYLFYYLYTYIFMPKEYLELSSILVVFLIGIGIMYLYSPFSAFLIMTNHLYWNILRVTLIAITNISFCILFILKFNILGAAIALSLSMFIELILLEILYRKIINFKLVFITVCGKIT